ncbi:MAG: deoxyguanosinetriphosphate triphosphohydrolase [Planctomycetes bacterium]|nr:deoxyguanosinetriphosphate triphosphohydrolase [Planctomycetota bacterium]
MIYAGEETLAPYAARSATSRGRVHPEEEHAFRGVYQRDRDRVIHSTAFRRLEYKTQVFVNHEGDHYRTRLTHTLEVSQISRSLARALRLNEDLTEAIALAHDLGHTPFGHSGEDALNELMAEHGGFEHNAQGLRVVDLLECRYPDFPGINPSYEVRESFAAHNTRHDSPSMMPEFASGLRPTLEAQLVAIADEIAYDNHDLDDGLASGILDEAEVRELAIWQSVTQKQKNQDKDLPPRLRWSGAIRRLINLEVTDVIDESTRRITVAGIKDIEEVRTHPGSLIAASPKLKAMKDELERFLYAKFYDYYTVRRMAARAKVFLTEMFHAYVADPRILPPDHQKTIARDGLERTIADYIAGMTDRFAQQEYRRLFSPFERM